MVTAGLVYVPRRQPERRLVSVSPQSQKKCNHYSLCAASARQAGICVYFTDLQAWKQLYELAERWHRRAEKQERQTHTEGGMRERQAETEIGRGRERKIGQLVLDIKGSFSITELLKTQWQSAGSSQNCTSLWWLGKTPSNAVTAQLFHRWKANGVLSKKSTWWEYLVLNTLWNSGGLRRGRLPQLSDANLYICLVQSHPVHGPFVHMDSNLT